MKAKQVLEATMVEDPRVLAKPRPVGYLMRLEKGYMDLQGLGNSLNLKNPIHPISAPVIL